MLVPRSVLGQSVGSVQGTVVDEADGTPLDAAVVTLEEIRTSATTGADGTFAVGDVPPGEYTLSVLREGFAPLVTRVTVTAGTPVLLDFVNYNVEDAVNGAETLLLSAGGRHPALLRLFLRRP